HTSVGAPYMVLAPEHPLVDSLTTPDRRDSVQAYRDDTARQDIVARKINREKSGVFTGAYVVNPATAAHTPIWIAECVLMDYGSRAMRAGPGNDERDLEFPTLFPLPIVRVIAPAGTD